MELRRLIQIDDPNDSDYNRDLSIVKAREVQLIDVLTENAKLTDDLYTLINFKAIDYENQELKKIIMKTQREN